MPLVDKEGRVVSLAEASKNTTGSYRYVESVSVTPSPSPSSSSIIDSLSSTDRAKLESAPSPKSAVVYDAGTGVGTVTTPSVSTKTYDYGDPAQRRDVVVHYQGSTSTLNLNKEEIELYRKAGYDVYVPDTHTVYQSYVKPKMYTAEYVTYDAQGEQRFKIESETPVLWFTSGTSGYSASAYDPTSTNQQILSQQIAHQAYATHQLQADRTRMIEQINKSNLPEDVKQRAVSYVEQGRYGHAQETIENYVETEKQKQITQVWQDPVLTTQEKWQVIRLISEGKYDEVNEVLTKAYDIHNTKAIIEVVKAIRDNPYLTKEEKMKYIYEFTKTKEQKTLDEVNVLTKERYETAERNRYENIKSSILDIVSSPYLTHEEKNLLVHSMLTQNETLFNKILESAQDRIVREEIAKSLPFRIYEDDLSKLAETYKNKGELKAEDVQQVLRERLEKDMGNVSYNIYSFAVSALTDIIGVEGYKAFAGGVRSLLPPEQRERLEVTEAYYLHSRDLSLFSAPSTVGEAFAKAYTAYNIALGGVGIAQAVRLGAVYLPKLAMSGKQLLTTTTSSEGMITKANAVIRNIPLKSIAKEIGVGLAKGYVDVDIVSSVKSLRSPIKAKGFVEYSYETQPVQHVYRFEGDEFKKISLQTDDTQKLYKSTKKLDIDTKPESVMGELKHSAEIQQYKVQEMIKRGEIEIKPKPKQTTDSLIHKPLVELRQGYTPPEDILKSRAKTIYDTDTDTDKARPISSKSVPKGLIDPSEFKQRTGFDDPQQFVEAYRQADPGESITGNLILEDTHEVLKYLDVSTTKTQTSDSTSTVTKLSPIYDTTTNKAWVQKRKNKVEYSYEVIRYPDSAPIETKQIFLEEPTLTQHDDITILDLRPRLDIVPSTQQDVNVKDLRKIERLVDVETKTDTKSKTKIDTDLGPKTKIDIDTETIDIVTKTSKDTNMITTPKPTLDFTLKQKPSGIEDLDLELKTITTTTQDFDVRFASQHLKQRSTKTKSAVSRRQMSRRKRDTYDIQLSHQFEDFFKMTRTKKRKRRG